MTLPAISRRQISQALALATIACRTGAPSSTHLPPSRTALSRLRELEAQSGGRLGVAWQIVGGGERLGYREQELFPMCSTFKLPLVAAILARVDTQRESLSRRVPYDESALLEYAPVTRKHVSDGAMTIEALCEAAVSLSDNTAANLLLQTLGGPPGLTEFFRSLGDATSRLDRTEPLLNTAFPGDQRDTTSPAAILGTMHHILVGETLREPSRQRLLTWLEQSPTGRSRLRAGLPKGWRAGDKTGTGENGATNDIAIAWPPSGAPLLIAAYTVGSPQSPEQRSATLAEVARVVTAPSSP